MCNNMHTCSMHMVPPWEILDTIFSALVLTEISRVFDVSFGFCYIILLFYLIKQLGRQL
jgi:hypothetical protein